MDVSGEEQMDLSHFIFKQRVDKWGNKVGELEYESKIGESTTHGAEDAKEIAKADPKSCGKCYGGVPPPSGCCNTCKDVQDAYLKKGWAVENLEDIEQCVHEGVAQQIKDRNAEGCNLYGHLNVQKVSGNFHFALGHTFISSQAHIHDLTPYLTRDFFFSHQIHYLSFGDELPGVVNPLDNVTKTAPPENAHYQYFLKVVGTRAVYLDGTSKLTNQYAVTQHEQTLGKGANKLPGLFFNYDISPMLVTYTEHRKSFTSFLTGVCAIIGGVFTVASILDSFIYRAERALGKKLELGKQM